MDIQAEIAALPHLVLPATETQTSTDNTQPLQIISRQGRIIMRMGASIENVEQRLLDHQRQLDERDRRIGALEDMEFEARRKARNAALAAIHIMDAQDWVYESLISQGQTAFAAEVQASLKDCLNKLAAAGIVAVPCEGEVDGRIHEVIETVEEEGTPPHHIARVHRRGYLYGTEVLRPAQVATAK